MKLIRSSTPWLVALVGGVCLVAAAVGLGQRPASTEITTAADATQLSRVFRGVAKKTLPSVVSIQVQQNAAEGGGPNFEEFLKDLPPEFRERFRNRGQFPAPRQPQGMGSGFIVDRGGIILTNYHVVKNATEVKVRLHDGREFIASDVKGDERTDVAIVRIQGAKDLVPLGLGDSDRIEVGDWVLAVGSPFGLDLSVTAGIISAKGRGPGIAEREDFLQTDAAINPGNSGGPLLDLKGQVVGINTAIATSTRSSAGVGFAVPVNMVRWVSRQLIDSGKVKRAWLGVGVEPVNAQIAQKHKARLGRGTIVGQVMPGSPAEKAGVQSDDIILKFNSLDVAGPRSLQGIVERLEVGKSYAMRILRNGKNLSLKVTVAEMPNRSPRPTPPPE